MSARQAEARRATGAGQKTGQAGPAGHATHAGNARHAGEASQVIAPVARLENSRTIRDTVAQRIQELITGGRLGEDGRLPTERDLATQLAVSRTTVRQVLDRLEHEGVVYRRRGRRGGTFVNRPRVDIDFSYLAGIPAYLRAQGFRPGAHVVSARMVPADDVTATALQITPGTPVYDVVRIRLADEVRISLENARIPVTLAPDLLAQPLDNSIYDLLTDRYGVTCAKAIERMVAVLANPEQSELLGVKVGDPLMAIERVAFDPDDKPVEYSSDLFVGDRTTVIAWAHGKVKKTTGTNHTRPLPEAAKAGAVASQDAAPATATAGD